MTYYVYLLESKKDKKQYIGITTNLDKRLKEHNFGNVKSTKQRKPFKLVGYEVCASLKAALKLEYKYKKSHGSLERAIKRKKFIIIGE